MSSLPRSDPDGKLPVGTPCYPTSRSRHIPHLWDRADRVGDGSSQTSSASGPYAERKAIQAAKAAFEAAKVQGNEAGQKLADAARAPRFGSLYAYIAQTIDLGDASLEGYASFARLLSKRLNGVPPDQVDQQALVPFTALIYELLKAGKNIDPSELDGQG